MASYTLTSNRFPDGTTVKAYPRSNWPSANGPAGTPRGSSVAEATKANGEATFTGLEAGTEYLAVAEVGGSYVYVGFLTDEEAAAAGVSEPRIIELVEAHSGSGGVQIFNVKSYGAEAKNSEKDNAEAFEKAIAAAEAAGAGIIDFANGEEGKKYYTSKPIEYDNDKGIHFLGGATIHFTGTLNFGECFFRKKAGSGNGRKHFFERVNITGNANWPTSPTGAEIKGYPPCYASGFEVFAHHKYIECSAENFYAGFHCKGYLAWLEKCEDGSCFYGRYLACLDNGDPTQGGYYFRDHASNSALWAAIGINPNRNPEGTYAVNENITQATYPIYREAPNGVSTGIMTGWKFIASGSQECGHGFIFDECRETYSSQVTGEGVNEVSAWMPMLNVSLSSARRIGNAQNLKIEATAGTFTITLPAQTEYNGGTAYAGGTTAAIKYNATDAEIASALEAAGGGLGWTPTVKTVSGEKFILIRGKGALMAGTKMTVNTGSLTGTATLSEPFMPEGMGPVIRPVTPKVVKVKNATGGNFTLSIKVGSGEKQTTANIAYNAERNTVHSKLSALSELTAYGFTVGHGSAPGEYVIFFNGKSLGKTIDITANTAGLTGAGAEVTIENGTAISGMALRHCEYSFDISGPVSISLEEKSFGLGAGTAGYFRCNEVGSRFRITGKAAEELVEKVEAGKVVALASSASVSKCTPELISGKRRYRLVKVKGPIEKGQLILSKASHEGEKYPAETNKGALAKPHAGFAGAKIEGEGSAWIPVFFEGYSQGTPAQYTGTAPAANAFVKPSKETAGKVEACSEASDKVIGRTLAAGSGGTVTASPLGCS